MKIKLTKKQYDRLLNEMRFDYKSTGLFASEEPKKVNEFFGDKVKRFVGDKKEKMGNSFRKFMSAARREGKETSEAATILLKLIRDKDSVSERDIKFLKAQSKDLAKIVGVVTMGAVSSFLPIAVEKMLNRKGISIMPSSQSIPNEDPETGEDLTEGRKKKRRRKTKRKSKKKKSTTLCARGKNAAKAKFDVYPSAYANGYAVQVCKGKIKGLDGTKKCSGKYCSGKKNESYEIGDLKVVERLSEVEEFDTWDDYIMSDYPNDPENRWDINSKKRRIHNNPDMEEDGKRWFNKYRNKYGTFRVKPHNDGYVGTFGSDDNELPWISSDNSRLDEDLAVWFGTKKKKKGGKQPQGPWVNICRKKKGGGHPTCGRRDSDKGGYPVCRAKSVASNMSQKAKDSACRRKREKEKNDGKSGKGQSPSPIRVKNYKPRKRKTSKRKSSKRKSKKNESININRMMITETSVIMSEGLKYHLDKQIPLVENVYRYGSESYFNLINEVRKLQSEGKIDLSYLDRELLNTDIGKKTMFEGKEVWLDIPMEDNEILTEVKFRGKTVKTRSPQRSSSGGKAYRVYVSGCSKKTESNPSGVKQIRFGSGGLKAKLTQPDRKKAYDARHGCSKGRHNDKCKAGYWSCRLPRYAKKLGLSGGGTWW